MATTDCLFTVNSVPHLLHLKDWDISTTSSVSSSGGIVAKEEIEFLKNLKTTTPINRAIKCGVKSIEHGNLLNTESVDLLIKHDAYLVPTLIIYKALIEQGVEAGLTQELVNKTYEVLDAGIDAVELAYKNKVQIVYGTDLLGIMHPHQLEEFTLRSKVIPSLQLIQQATINAAKLFNMDKEIGQVNEGFFADLIVLNKNPVDDIKVLTDPKKYLRNVIKNGYVCNTN